MGRVGRGKGKRHRATRRRDQADLEPSSGQPLMALTLSVGQ